MGKKDESKTNPSDSLNDELAKLDKKIKKPQEKKEERIAYVELVHMFLQLMVKILWILMLTPLKQSQTLLK